MAVSGVNVARTSANEGPWQLAVFDLDGTLVDTRQDLMEALDDTVAPRVLDTTERKRAAAALPLGMHAMLAATLDESAAKNEATVRELEDRYLTTYASRIARHSRPYPEVLETLCWLCARGVQLALCSNKPRHLSDLLLRILRLYSFFPVIVGPECTGRPKPHPEPLRHAAWLSNVPRSRSVLIGDTGIDLECAEQAGVSSWIFSGGYEPSVCSRAPRIFDRFDELRQPAYWAQTQSRILDRKRSLV